QAVWMKEADAMPKEDFPVEPKRMQEELVRVLHILHNKFPEDRLSFQPDLRRMGGVAAEPGAACVRGRLLGEVADRRPDRRKPELNYDPAKGAVQSPWIAWGPY